MSGIAEEIKAKLREIETKEQVKILHAMEAVQPSQPGLGFASPDSDYDVRFIYVRPRECYLRSLNGAILP